jgi:hypothetical protein
VFSFPGGVVSIFKVRPIVLGLAILAPVILVPMTGGTQALAYSDGFHLCLTNASSYCIDVKDDAYVEGQPVWLYDGGQSDAIQSVYVSTVTTNDGPFTDKSLDQQFNGDQYGFFYAENMSGADTCVTESGGTAELGSCQGTGRLWVAVPDSDGSFLVSVLNSDANDQAEMLTAKNDTDKQALILQSTVSGWQQWGPSPTGIGFGNPDGCVPSPPCWND